MTVYAILGAIIGLSVSSAIHSYQYDESYSFPRFVILIVLAVIALIILFVRDSK